MGKLKKKIGVVDINIRKKGLRKYYYYYEKSEIQVILGRKINEWTREIMKKKEGKNWWYNELKFLIDLELRHLLKLGT